MTERINFDDPNADLFSGEGEEKSEEEQIYDQIYGKNANRVSAMNDLWYNDLIEEIKALDLPEEAKYQMIFKITANSVLDMIADASSVESALDVSYSFDMFVGVSLTNKRFKVDLFEEHHKALLTIEREKFGSDEEYERAINDFEEAWWDIPQPLLEKRTPNDAITETLAKYGLNDQ